MPFSMGRANVMLQCAVVMVLLFGVVNFGRGAQSSPPQTDKSETIRIWPHGAPGPRGSTGPERNESVPGKGLVAGRPIIRLTNVSDPTITIYRPPRQDSLKAAVVVFPGGAYRILAMDLEGTEICRWLNSLGITAVLLKYRVPEPAGMPNYTEPLQDAQRALGIVRSRAPAWGLDPHRIGVIGFSAGGNLAAVLSTNFEKRTYARVDAADEVSCRPDFAMLIYPAYLVIPGKGDELAPEIHVTRQTPPSFLVQTEHDPVHVENSIYYYLALKNADVPAEMHLYARGRHGYGLRRTDERVTRWPILAAQWLRSLGVLRAGITR